jgi:SH3-like domain-containing protein
MPDSPSFPDDSRRFRQRLAGFAAWSQRSRRDLRRVVGAALLVACGLSAQVPTAATGQADDPLPLPRFASFKSNEVNLRTGPGEDKPKLWVYQRAGMPVEIIEEFDTWRRVRDYQGTVGWVSVNLLTSRRTAIITGARRTLLRSPDATASPVAQADPGVIGKLLECGGAWCRLEIQGYKGWLQRTDFWGVYPDETIKE